jgi:hypothetical protein
MSLINDALKEAKQAQREAAPPPAPNLQLRPVEPAQYTRPKGGLMWPTALLAVALVLLVMIWQQNHRTDETRPTEVLARTAMPATPAVAPAPPVTAVSPAPAPQPVIEAAPAPTRAPKAAPTNGTEIAAAPLSLDSPSVAAPEEGVTHTPAATDAPPPKPRLPKLQGILFSPTRPCAMISGKTLCVGDKIEDLRIAAITPESVTLIGAGQTNVLSLAR